MGTDYDFNVNAKSIFGRHCAILGTTGGGKSYTVARLVEELGNTGGKAILFDATGEYENLQNVKFIKFGDDACLHYSKLLMDDMFVLLNPSGQVQKPILLEAIKSLKLLKCENGSENNITKSGLNKEDFARRINPHTQVELLCCTTHNNSMITHTLGKQINHPELYW